jgi:hypothetical protein
MSSDFAHMMYCLILVLNEVRKSYLPGIHAYGILMQPAEIFVKLLRKHSCSVHTFIRHAVVFSAMTSSAAIIISRMGASVVVIIMWMIMGTLRTLAVIDNKTFRLVHRNT